MQTSPIGFIKEEIVRGKDGAEVSCTYYERNGWRDHGQARFYDSPEALVLHKVQDGGNKRTVNVREVVNGLMYVLSTGCQWRAIPKDLPPRSTVYDYFDVNWDGTLDRILALISFKSPASRSLATALCAWARFFVPWRGAVAVGAAVTLRAAAIFAAVFAFDESSFVFCGTAVLGIDCEPRSSPAMAFSPAFVNCNEYAWPVASARRSASKPQRQPRRRENS